MRATTVCPLIVALLAVTSCGAHHTSAGRATRPKVTVIGDSITHRATPQIAAAMASRYEATVQGYEEFTAGQLQPTLNTQLATAPAIVVIEEGTNDAIHQVAMWRDEFNALIRSVATVPCVAFVNLYASADDYFGYLGSREHKALTIAAEWNAALNEVIATHANFHLIDWNAAVVDNLSLTTDAIHPSATGKAWLASHIRAEVDRRCGRAAS